MIALLRHNNKLQWCQWRTNPAHRSKWKRYADLCERAVWISLSINVASMIYIHHKSITMSG